MDSDFGGDADRRPRARIAFEIMTLSGKGDAGALAAGLRKGVTSVGLQALAAKLLHVAVCAPERVRDVYDAAAHGWLASGAYAPTTRNTGGHDPGPDFWAAFWRLLDKPPEVRRALPFTVATVHLSGLHSRELDQRAAAAALAYAGVREAVAAGRLGDGAPAPTAVLASDSLGALVRVEGLRRGVIPGLLKAADLELDRLPPPLGYLNARVLETYLPISLVAGYSTSDLDELALAAFQIAQFGHPYSATLIALAVATLAFQRPPGLEQVLDSIFRGWIHGRQTPLLLAVNWDSQWDRPLADVRHALGVVPFDPPMAEPVQPPAARRDLSA